MVVWVGVGIRQAAKYAGSLHWVDGGVLELDGGAVRVQNSVRVLGH